ncbi:hypothetical protein KSP39_PZI002245 [Platanthera zijinensis]|uniref:Complex I assembly factor TIMMDC1, mitochondrial n=1 Tax=Platanthera zijinensis TaxID=2320716 RepID=A0AAP0BYA8_9ASPA
MGCLVELDRCRRHSPQRYLGLQDLVGHVATIKWIVLSLVGSGAGQLYGGSKEAAASISKDVEIVLNLGSTPDKHEQYRLTRDAMGKRFIQVTRGSIVGGVRLGMFTSTFYCLNHLLTDIREVRDVFSVTGAGSATATIFGLILPCSVKWSARNVLHGSALGAGICFPLGWLHMKLIEKSNKKMLPSNMTQAMNTSVVSAAIERLEGGGRASFVMVALEGLYYIVGGLIEAT